MDQNRGRGYVGTLTSGNVNNEKREKMPGVVGLHRLSGPPELLISLRIQSSRIGCVNDGASPLIPDTITQIGYSKGVGS